MEFTADLHLHSHFSRATAKNLDIENLYTAAQIKGITLVGTGDVTHPGWVSELQDKLEPDGNGLFRLKPSLSAPLDAQVPKSCRAPVRFILQAEISSIYKRNDRVRKNHNLLYFPDLDTVRRFNTILAGIGNITSDGRPILGLDARKLLEIMLDTSEDAFFIPAHIWTPWFSLFGSKSGFDSIKECFGPLTDHIFAAETGLSSNPPMNWRVADLDGITLVSNSDAHSPMMMGRNACRFDTELSFHHVRKALETGDPDTYLGTIDMYPEEGKYHFDGHRKCNVCFSPSETIAHQGICPECNRPLTLGVLYRANQLATRPVGFSPEDRHGFKSIIPLTDILAELLDVGPKTKKVAALYNRMLESLGPELEILLKTDSHDIKALGVPLLKDAIERMRSGDVDIAPGYDGEYGKVRLFSPSEKERLKGHRDLFPSMPPSKIKKKPASKAAGTAGINTSGIVSGDRPQKQNPTVPEPPEIPAKLNPEQQRALDASGHPLLIQAGPGTGKTKTLTTKIAWLITHKEIAPENILALTFTNRAAGELKERLSALVPGTGESVHAVTFHALCLMILKTFLDRRPSIADETTCRNIMDEAFSLAGFKRGQTGLSKNAVIRTITDAKQRCLTPESSPALALPHGDADKIVEIWSRYQALLSNQNLMDFEDIITTTYRELSSSPTLLMEIRRSFTHIFVDEYQDVNHGQYLLTRLLAGNGNTLFVIGDPDQSIYGFRGSSNDYFNRFLNDYPDAEKIILKQNYRSSQTILNASFQIISKGEGATGRERLFSDVDGNRRILIQEAASDSAEAVAVGKTIERLVGGISLFSFDSGVVDGVQEADISFSDIAVLYRTGKQAKPFIQAFTKAGIPFQTADKENLTATPIVKGILALARLATGKGSVTDFETALLTVTPGTAAKSPSALAPWFYSQCCPVDSLMETLRQTPVPKIRKPAQERIRETAEMVIHLKTVIQGLDPASALAAISETTGLSAQCDAQLSDTLAFLNMRAAACGSLTDFLDTLLLNTDPDTLVPEAENVTLMTMHASKGLEFPVVFVTGCEDGLIPFSFPGADPADINEERRLFYVAATRAKHMLFLTHAARRRTFNTVQDRKRSPFLDDIEDRLTALAKSRFKKTRPAARARQLDLFEH